jgi:hypothetical protein
LVKTKEKELVFQTFRFQLRLTHKKKQEKKVSKNLFCSGFDSFLGWHHDYSMKMKNASKASKVASSGRFASVLI